MWKRLPFGPRPLAILLMIAGAAGFVATRVLFGEQVICLLGSTLVTFGGLGLIIAARRYGWEQPGERDAAHREVQFRQPFGVRGHTPSGLRRVRENGRISAAVEEHAPSQESRIDLPRQEPYEPMPPLALRVMKILRQQGARVVVDTRRDDRSIFIIETGEGEQFLAMVLEAEDPVDVADLRALNALVNANNYNGGYLITGGSFTPHALDWSAGRPLRLLTRDDLGMLTI